MIVYLPVKAVQNDVEDDEGDEEDDEVAHRKTTYKSFLALWTSLLDSQYLKVRLHSLSLRT